MPTPTVKCTGESSRSILEERKKAMGRPSRNPGWEQIRRKRGRTT